MGSGGSSSYSGASGYQPYAESYHVIQKKLSKDKHDSDIYNHKTGYFKKPADTNLDDATHDKAVYTDSKKANGTYTYVRFLYLKQIAVAAGSDKFENKDVFLYLVNKEPIRLDMAFPHILIIPRIN